MTWGSIRYFKREEFRDPLHGPESGDLIDDRLVYALDRLRHETGWPIVIHWQLGGAVDVDGSHGHASRSYHLASRGCKAADWHFVTDAPLRYQYYKVCLGGFPGIGVYPEWHNPGFHTDLRPTVQCQHWTRRGDQYIYFP